VEVEGVSRRKSIDITRAELISMVARLRGALYTASEAANGDLIDKDEIRSLLDQTAFDCDGDSFNAPEPAIYRIGTNTIQIETAVLVRIERDESDEMVGAFFQFLAGQLASREVEGLFSRVEGTGRFVGTFTPESEGVIRQWFEDRLSHE
jgi:hypothetical protein